MGGNSSRAAAVVTDLGRFGRALGVRLVFLWGYELMGCYRLLPLDFLVIIARAQQ